MRICEKLAQSQESSPHQRQVAKLLQKNQQGVLTRRENELLARFRMEIDCMVIRRSYAYLLLKSQGFWKAHLKWIAEGTEIKGLTPCGRATIEALHLNRPELVGAR